MRSMIEFVAAASIVFAQLVFTFLPFVIAVYCAMWLIKWTLG